MKRRSTGLGLAVVGGSIAIGGIALALRELGGLYAGALENPLGQPQSAESDASRQMLTYATVGAAGIVPMVIGVALVRGRFWGRKI